MKKICVNGIEVPEAMKRDILQAIAAIQNAADKFIDVSDDPVEVYKQASDLKHAALVNMVADQTKLFTSDDNNASFEWLCDEVIAEIAMVVMGAMYTWHPEHKDAYAKIRAKFKSKQGERLVK